MEEGVWVGWHCNPASTLQESYQLCTVAMLVDGITRLATIGMDDRKKKEQPNP